MSSLSIPALSYSQADQPPQPSKRVQESVRAPKTQPRPRGLVTPLFCVLILMTPSLYLLCTYPPLWKDIDGVNQLVAAPGVINILHFPPLYSFFARIPFWITSGYSIFQEQAPRIAGTYLLVISQHLFLVGCAFTQSMFWARQCRTSISLKHSFRKHKLAILLGQLLRVGIGKY